MTTDRAVELERRACNLLPQVCKAMMESYEVYLLSDDHSDVQQLASELNHLLREAYNVSNRLHRESVRL